MRRIALATAAVLVMSFAATTAHAGPRNRQTARVLSGTAAGVSGAVALTGFLTVPEGEAFNKPVLYTGVGMLFVMPSLGEMYSGQYLTWGMGVRAVATGLALWTLQKEVEPVICDTVGANKDLNCKQFKENAYPLLGVAAIAFIGGVFYDVLDAPDAADRFNARHGFVVAPAPINTGSGMAPGLTFMGSF
jgi:hypothetical protein